MIDFQNTALLKLRQVNDGTYSEMINPLLIKDEYVIGTYQAIRDGIVFTNKRVIAINVQGITGKKKDFTSLPYNKIQAFSIETAGVLDLDSELDLWFSGFGKVRMEFTSATNVADICRIISEYVLE